MVDFFVFYLKNTRFTFEYILEKIEKMRPICDAENNVSSSIKIQNINIISNK